MNLVSTQHLAPENKPNAPDDANQNKDGEAQA